jgi:hypothetical protein
LQAAKEHAKSPSRYSEAIEAAQECVELSVKSILSLLDVPFPYSHEWKHDKPSFIAMADKIQDRDLVVKLTAQYLNYTIDLPRLLFLVNFWVQFYITSKYGIEVCHSLVKVSLIVTPSRSRLHEQASKSLYSLIS